MIKNKVFSINSDSTIRHAVQKLDKHSIDTLVIIDNDKIIGVFTMGDFRRAVLRGLDINDSIASLVNHNYLYIKESVLDKNLVIKMFNDNPKVVDILVVDDNHKLIGLLSKEDYVATLSSHQYMKNIDVVIMAGGKGTRLDPFTRILPKPLIPIGNDPIIKVIMNEFAHYGISSFYLSINEKADMIKAYFHDHDLPYSIGYLQESKPLGTAGSLSMLELSNDKLIVVTNCDIIVRSSYDTMLRKHIDGRYDITIIASMQSHTIPYGVCELDEYGDLDVIHEKPNNSYLVNTGLYIISPCVLKLIPENQYFDMTDLILKAKENSMNIGVHPISEDSWFDVGQWEEYSETLKSLPV